MKNIYLNCTIKDLRENANYRISIGRYGECLLEFFYLNSSSIGDYVCSVANLAGNDSLIYTIEKLFGYILYRLLICVKTTHFLIVFDLFQMKSVLQIPIMG
jgi:hypothetical protein